MQSAMQFAMHTIQDFWKQPAAETEQSITVVAGLYVNKKLVRTYEEYQETLSVNAMDPITVVSVKDEQVKDPSSFAGPAYIELGRKYHEVATGNEITFADIMTACNNKVVRVKVKVSAEPPRAAASGAASNLGGPMFLPSKNNSMQRASAFCPADLRTDTIAERSPTPEYALRQSLMFFNEQEEKKRAEAAKIAEQQQLAAKIAEQQEFAAKAEATLRQAEADAAAAKMQAKKDAADSRKKLLQAEQEAAEAKMATARLLEELKVNRAETEAAKMAAAAAKMAEEAAEAKSRHAAEAAEVVAEIQEEAEIQAGAAEVGPEISELNRDAAGSAAGSDTSLVSWTVGAMARLSSLGLLNPWTSGAMALFTFIMIIIYACELMNVCDEVPAPVGPVDQSAAIQLDFCAVKNIVKDSMVDVAGHMWGQLVTVAGFVPQLVVPVWGTLLANSTLDKVAKVLEWGTELAISTSVKVAGFVPQFNVPVSGTFARTLVQNVDSTVPDTFEDLQLKVTELQQAKELLNKQLADETNQKDKQITDLTAANRQKDEQIAAVNRQKQINSVVLLTWANQTVEAMEAASNQKDEQIAAVNRQKDAMEAQKDEQIAAVNRQKDAMEAASKQKDERIEAAMREVENALSDLQKCQSENGTGVVHVENDVENGTGVVRRQFRRHTTPDVTDSDLNGILPLTVSSVPMTNVDFGVIETVVQSSRDRIRCHFLPRCKMQNANIRSVYMMIEPVELVACRTCVSESASSVPVSGTFRYDPKADAMTQFIATGLTAVSWLPEQNNTNLAASFFLGKQGMLLWCVEQSQKFNGASSVDRLRAMCDRVIKELALTADTRMSLASLQQPMTYMAVANRDDFAHSPHSLCNMLKGHNATNGNREQCAEWRTILCPVERDENKPECNSAPNATRRFHHVGHTCRCILHQ